jgi:transcriptional regulator with XRE-family HTH domain
MARKPPPASEPAPPPPRAARRTSAELDAEVPAGSLQERVLRLMRERKMSAKALSRAAGLTEDSVRAIVRGRVSSPRSKNLAQLAAALGLSIDALVEGTGLVPEGVADAAVGPTDRREVDVPEVDLRARGGAELPDDPRRVPRHRTWSIPADLLEEQGIAPGALAVVRVSGGVEGIAATDRVLVDLSERRAGGLCLVWSDGVYAVERTQPRVRGSMQPSRDDIIGRIVGKWGWLL